jgi:hypothetical protein
VGTYTITQDTLTAGDNYTISVDPTVKFEITPAPLTITPISGQTKEYGQPDPPTFTCTVSGWKYTDDETLLTGALSRDAGDDVGTYHITQGSLAARNYTINFTPTVKFEITPAPLIITPTSGQTKVYGANDPTFTCTASGWKHRDDETLFAGALSRNAGNDVGLYAITQGTLVAGDNYDIRFITGVKFEITPAPLTITPTGNRTKVYGQPDPPTFDYTATGWKNNEDETLFTGALSREAGNDVGLYTITQGTLTAGDNYVIHVDPSVKFEITPATLTLADLDFDPLPDATYNVTRDDSYDGTAHPVVVTPNSPYTDLGVTVTVKYNGSTDVPVDAGEYNVTVHIAGGTNFAAVVLSLDTLTIGKATPKVAFLDFDLSDIVYRGVPQGIDTPRLADPYTGLGAVTVKYNGFTRLPNDPGTYTVTVDIAEGANFTGVKDLLLGTFTILAPPPPPTIVRKIFMPEFPSLTTDPPAGVHYIISGDDFRFTFTPSFPYAGYPIVTSGRESDHNGDGGVICTPNGDGSYTVRILCIRENLTIGITFDGADATTAVEGTRVWSHGSRVYIASARTGRAQIYTFAGTLVKTVITLAGETVTEVLPMGKYIIRTGEDRGYKILIES